jgi:hypothetical protein
LKWGLRFCRRQVWRWLSARTSETSGNFYKTTRCNIPDDSNPHNSVFKNSQGCHPAFREPYAGSWKKYAILKLLFYILLKF